MKLFILKLLDEYQFDPGVSFAFGMVIRSINEDTARMIASLVCGDEGMEVWKDHLKTSCYELPQEGAVEVVLKDFRKA